MAEKLISVEGKECVEVLVFELHTKASEQGRKTSEQMEVWKELKLERGGFHNTPFNPSLDMNIR